MSSDLVVKISELTKASTIAEKDILPFSTSLVNGTETTQSISVAMLRLFMTNPTIYASANDAAADTKDGDYCSVYADTLKAGCNIYLNTAGALTKLVDEDNDPIVFPVPSQIVGNSFTYSAAAGDIITFPTWLSELSGYKRVIIYSIDNGGIFGEYVLAKSVSSQTLAMSSANVYTENTPGQFIISWAAYAPISIKITAAGQFRFRVY